MRDLFLRACVGLGVTTAVITELLSPFHLLRRVPLLLAWLPILAIAVWWGRRFRLPRLVLEPVETTIALAIAAIGALLALTSILSPPNSFDALAYHMPRVVYWAQSGSVAFFPTPYLNQISMPPLAEYCALHTYLLSGGDRFVNLLTCAAFLAAVVAVSALAAELGLTPRGQAFAALFCATLPNGILQASGAKNDCLLALWLICAVYFAARRSAPLTGLSLGLAIATKGTAYLFAPPLLAVILILRRPRFPVAWLAWLAAGILLLNTPQYVRNVGLSGSPFGYDSAQGDGVYRWRTLHPGLKSTVSNLIRHTSEQLGSRGARWNQAVFHAAIALHRALGIDPFDPANTWPGARFSAPENSNHEADGNNRWHLLLLLAAAVFAAVARRLPWILYTFGLLAALLLFCFYLRWQPYMVRLELPLFALAAPLAGAFMEALRPAILSLVICLFLAGTARLPLLQNWTRPLQGPHSLFVTARDENYFTDMLHWDRRATYLPAVDLSARSRCTEIGIDISRNQLEYPYQALLRERNPAVRFFHTGVENQSVKYTPAAQPAPCIVFCPDCAGDARKIAVYSSLGPPDTLGSFLLFRAILPAK